MDRFADTNPVDVPVLVKLCPSHTYEFHTNILYMNLHAHDEPTSILYGKNLFVAWSQRKVWNIGLDRRMLML